MKGFSAALSDLAESDSLDLAIERLLFCVVRDQDAETTGTSWDKPGAMGAREVLLGGHCRTEQLQSGTTGTSCFDQLIHKMTWMSGSSTPGKCFEHTDLYFPSVV